MARALAGVVNILDPDVIVLGGGISQLTRLYTNVPPLLARYAFSDSLARRLVPPAHGDSSGVRGRGLAVGPGRGLESSSPNATSLSLASQHRGVPLSSQSDWPRPG